MKMAPRRLSSTKWISSAMGKCSTLTLFAAAFVAVGACGSSWPTRGDTSRVLERNDEGRVEIAAAAPEEGVMLQVFNWPFARITEELDEFSRRGYTHLHVSPPGLSINRTEWWARYQPLDYRVIDGPLGNEAEFAEMNRKAESLGIKIIADVVFNHMANPDFARYDTRYTDNPEQLYYPDPNTREAYGLSILFEPEDFNATGCISSYNNRIEVLYNRLCLGFPDKGLPDLNLNRENVLEAQRTYLDKLIDLGVDGFRFDALKHLPPEYLNVVLRDVDRDSLLIFGEIITSEDNLQRNIGPYYEASDLSFYDFPLLFVMNRAFGPQGNLRELIDPESFSVAVPGERSITFVTNHDIPNNGDIFSFLRFYDTADEHLAYAYILGRSTGLAYVYTDLGTADGLDSNDYLNAHLDNTVAEMIQFRRDVRGTSQIYLWEGDQTLVWSRGANAFVVLHKSGSSAFNLSQVQFAGLEDGVYRDRLSGFEFSIENERLAETDSAYVLPRRPAFFQKVSN